MARELREKSNNGFYCVKIQRINSEKIFYSIEDYEKITEILKRTKEKHDFYVLAYCFVDSNVDLLIKSQDISKAVKWFTYSISRYLKRKYNIEENIFKRRFSCVTIDEDKVCENIVKIHNIPVKTHFCDENCNYKYSSFSSYFGNNIFVYTDFVFSQMTITDFFELHYTYTDDFESDNERIFKIKKTVCKYLGLADFREIKYIDNDMKKEAIAMLYYKEKCRVIDITKVFNVGRQRVYVILKNSWRKTIDKI